MCSEVSAVMVDAQCPGSSSSSVSQLFEYLANGTCLPCPSGCSECLSAADDVRYPCTACSQGFVYVANPRSDLTAGGLCVTACDDLGLLATSRDSSRVRLASSGSDPGTTESEGRLEVWYGGRWWSVCDDRWTLTNTDVVCQEMGLGRGVSSTPRYNAANLWTAMSTVLMGFDDVDCDVTHTSILECRHAPFGFPPDCTEQQTIGLRCAGSAGNRDYCVSSCPVGHFPDIASSRCRSCDVTGCILCPAEGVCTRCEQPLWLLNQTCVETCPPGYYGNTGTRDCRRCDVGCLTCADGASGSVCTSCRVTLALYDGACVEECPRDRLLWNVTTAVCGNKCPRGSYQPMTSSSRLCLPCIADCRQCLGAADNCTACVTSGHVLVTRGNGVTSCEPRCPVGQYPDVDNRCVQCDDSRCERCSVGGQYCWSCIDHYDRLEMGRCVRSCSPGLYPNPGRGCLSSCPRGQYSDHSGRCQQCLSPCRDCLSSDICLTCQPGYYLLTNQRTCVSQCGRGLVQYSSPRHDDVNIRLVGGLLPLDGAVQLFTRGNVASKTFCLDNTLLFAFTSVFRC